MSTALSLHNRTNVDNSGRGNCGYYSYAHGLIAALKTAQNPDWTQTIFARLQQYGLTDQNRVILQSLIDSTAPLFSGDNGKTIERILGPVLRHASAEIIAQEVAADVTSFETNQSAAALKSNTLTTLQYFIRNAFTETAPAADYADSDVGRLIQTPEMKNALQRFMTTRLAQLDPQPNLQDNDNPLVDALVAQSAIGFYQEHLQIAHQAYITSNGKFAEETTLISLHGALTQDVDIPLVIARDGNTLNMSTSDTTVILNNHSNIHWTTFIDTAQIALQQLHAAISQLPATLTSTISAYLNAVSPDVGVQNQILTLNENVNASLDAIYNNPNLTQEQRETKAAKLLNVAVETADSIVTKPAIATAMRDSAAKSVEVKARATDNLPDTPSIVPVS